MSVFIIAEAGINHGGSISTALEMIDVAADAGCDAVKFQSFTADALGYDADLTAFLRTCQLTRDAHYLLKNRADVRGIEFMSTPFDADWCDFLVELGVKRLKISSGKVRDIDFVKHVASHGLPVIMSNGMADGMKFRLTVESCMQPVKDLTLLYCVSEYPTPLHHVNLKKMFNMMQFYTCKIGFSDHTCGIEAAIIAAASGAQVLEKHFSMDRSLPGPDQCCSLEPRELWDMVQQIRKVGT